MCFNTDLLTSFNVTNEKRIRGAMKKAVSSWHEALYVVTGLSYFGVRALATIIYCILNPHSV